MLALSRQMASHFFRRNDGFAVAEMGGHYRRGRASALQQSYLHDYWELSETQTYRIIFQTSLNSIFLAILPKS